MFLSCSSVPACVPKSPSRLCLRRKHLDGKIDLSAFTEISCVQLPLTTLACRRPRERQQQNPDVFKAPASETHIIFGEAKIEDMNAQAQTAAAAAEQFKTQGGMAGGEAAAMQQILAQQQMAAAAANASTANAGASGTTIEEVDGDAVDEEGIDGKDIDLVMTQAGTSRAKAVKALRAANGDIVSAIMELTV